MTRCRDCSLAEGWIGDDGRCTNCHRFYPDGEPPDDEPVDRMTGPIGWIITS
jgi:hypothetical protein